MNEKDKLILESLKELLYNCESVNSTYLVSRIKELLNPKKETKPYADEFKEKNSSVGVMRIKFKTDAEDEVTENE